MSITDACGGATWSHTPESPNQETWINGYAITEVFFIATDECGNSNSKEAHFKLKNNFPPSLSALADKTIDCGSTPPAFDTPTIANSCGITTLSNIETNIPGPCPGTYTLTNTWTVTDACGASSTSVQNIFVIDNMAPETSTTPADLSLQCASEIPAPEALSAEDNCAGTITVLPTSEMIPGACANSFTLIRTWTFDDGCGNISAISQTITVHDDIAPIAPVVPENLILECASEIPAPINLTAQDNCDGEITVAPVESLTPGDCPNQFTLIRTWIFTDICGNESNVSQTISVNDTSAPEAPTAPADLTLQCVDEIPAPIELIAQDNCNGEITVAPVESLTSGDCPNQFTLIRTWTFTDACGNESSVNQTISVHDDIAPIAPIAPAELTIQCADEVPTSIDLTAEDNCDGEITVAPIEMITAGDCPNQFTILRTWTFTDVCGNESSVSQTIRVRDDTAPDLPEAPEDLTFQCAADVTEPIELSAIDNCDGLLNVVLPTIEIINGDCTDQFVMIRRWTFADACGNESSISQTVTVQDDIAPEFTFVPADAFQDCGEEPQFGIPEATDNCSDVIIHHEDEEGDCSITRLWIVLDACGNSNIATQTITYEDDEAPEFTFIPENVENVECNAIPDFEEPIAADNCGSVVITFVETSDEPDVCQDNGYGIYRTWTATDRCGNTSTVKTLLWIEEDYREPDFITFPEDLVITCDEFPPVITEEPTAIDNCSEPIITYYTEYGTGGPESCDEGEGFDWHVVWMATDACGNVQTKIQNIWVDPYLQANLGAVEGEVFNENNQMIEEVSVQTNGGNISMVETTIEDGYFDFTLPLGNNYEIKPTKNDDPLNGISTFDLILMSQHILGIETLGSPYKLIAADINNSGTITAFDMIELRKLILFIYDELP